MLRGLKNKIKNTGLFGKSYGTTWKGRTGNWYLELFNARPLLHKNFINYLKAKNDLKTVLEVGCGTGVYPIQFKELFSNLKYTGTDISETAIEQCTKHSQFEFICGDFIKMEFPEKYDLVFSLAVIDHVYDIDRFLAKIVQISKKYAYINAYRGYFPNLNKHKMNWRADEGCYYNDLAVNQIKETLIQSGLSEDEFIIRPQESGQKNLEIETVIEINKR